MRKTSILLILTFGLIQTLFSQENSQMPNHKGYLLAPGDEIIVKVMGEKDFDFESALDENGNVSVPFFDEPVPAMCKTERDLQSDISKLLGKYIRTPRVSLKIKERKSRPPTTVYGAVRNPQPFVLMRAYRLSEILAQAGGETEEAGGIVQVLRPQAPICGSAEEIAEWKEQSNNAESIPRRLYTLSIIKKGNTDQENPYVYPGDLVLVDKAKPVYLIGEVRGGQGGIYITERGLRLTDAIAMAGGVNREAKTKDIKIYRQRPNSLEKDIIPANLNEIKLNKQPDIMLEPYDVIEVDKARQSVGGVLLQALTNGAVGGVGQVFTGGAMRVLY